MEFFENVFERTLGMVEDVSKRFKALEKENNLDDFKCSDCGEFNEYCTCYNDQDLSDNEVFE